METTPQPATNFRPERKKESNRLVYILIILFLLGMNGYLLYIYLNTDKALETEQSNLVDVKKEKAEVEKLLLSAKLDLESYRGINDSLNDAIDEMKDELNNQALEIQGLLNSKNLTKKEYERAMEKYEKFKYYYEKTRKELDEKLIELDAVKKENTDLKASVKTLEGDKDKLDGEKRKAISDLDNAKILEAVNISTVAIRIRSVGKEQETTKASKTEQLKISFGFARNAVAEHNRKDVYVKIFGPDGVAIRDDQAGSGTFKFAGQESVYTVKQSVDFTNNSDIIYIYYKRAGEFKKGKYKVELYCEGYQLNLNPTILELK
ncbi:MAG: hypothetical protein SGJ10_00610 [Bacteroidota bacterium]|nr:hypothetical protein [Bacteroidota bacterium]